MHIQGQDGPSPSFENIIVRRRDQRHRPNSSIQPRRTPIGPAVSSNEGGIAIESRMPHHNAGPSFPAAPKYGWWSVRTATIPLALPARTPSPPTLIYEKSPYQCVSLPAQVESSAVAINPVLEYSERDPLVRVDLSRRPQRYGYCLLEPATCPPLPSLAVVSPLVPCAIVVQRSSAEYVTVGEVLVAIRYAIQIAGRNGWERSGERAAESAYAGDEARRLECLGGKHMFMGLSKSPAESDTWVLHVAQAPGLEYGGL